MILYWPARTGADQGEVADLLEASGIAPPQLCRIRSAASVNTGVAIDVQRVVLFGLSLIDQDLRTLIKMPQKPTTAGQQ